MIAGDMKEIVCTHPTLGTYHFEAKANESYNIDKGGVRVNDDNSNVTGNGKHIKIMNLVGWSVEGPIMVDLKSSYEEDAMIALAASPDPGVWTFSHISGMIRKGTGQPLGDINVDTNNAQLKIKIGGGGILETI